MERPMRIVFVTENGYCGGLDSFIVTLATHWPDSADRLILLCNHDHPGLAVIRARAGRRVRVVGHHLPTALRWLTALRRLPGGRLLAKAASPLARYLALAAQVAGWRRILRRLDPDRVMVINGGYPGGDSCRAALVAWAAIRGGRPKALLNIHNLASPVRWWEAPMEAVVDRMAGRAALGAVAVSAACAASVVAVRPRFARATAVSVVHNGIAPAPAPALGALRGPLGLGADVPLGLMLGTYEPRKGHDFLLRAWVAVVRACPAAHLVIAGWGQPAERAHVAALVEAYGLTGHVTLLGFRDDVPAMIAESDVMLVASQAFESFGLTVVEAMAQRVPVVATAVGGVPEVVGEGAGAAGLLVARDDSEGFARQVLALFADPARRARLGEQGHARFLAHFTAGRMAAAYASRVRAAGSPPR